MTKSLCTVREPTLAYIDTYLPKTYTDKFDDATGNYTQTVSINGQVVATLSTDDGQAQGWGSAVECAENNCGTVGAHCKSRRNRKHRWCNAYIFTAWKNTTIILDSEDPNYDQTNAKGEGVTGEMSTSDGGKTWVVTTIEIPEFTFGA
jgi:hypothetical protein